MAFAGEVAGTVHLVARDTPCNIRYEEGKGNADHDRLKKDFMDAFVVYITSVMKKGGKGHVF